MIENQEQYSVVITGASRGIGERIAYEFSKNTRHPLILLARNKDDLHRVKNGCHKLGAKDVFIHPCDLTQEKDLESIQFPPAFEKIVIIVNNTGTFLAKKLQDTSVEQFVGQFNINVMAAFNTVHHFLPILQKEQYGYIITICSVASLAGSAGSGAYVTSKHAILGYTRSLRQELKKDNIGVTAINLGSTYSTSWKGSGVDPNRLIDPDDVACLIRHITELSPRSVVEEVIMRPMLGDYK